MQYFSFLCPVYVFRHWEDKGRGPAQSHSCPRPVRGPRKAAHAGPEMHSKAAAQSPRGPAAACPLAICKPHVFERPAPSPHHRTASHVPSAPGPGSALPPSKATPGTHTAQSPEPRPSKWCPGCSPSLCCSPRASACWKTGGSDTHPRGLSGGLPAVAAPPPTALKFGAKPVQNPPAPSTCRGPAQFGVQGLKNTPGHSARTPSVYRSRTSC